MKIHFNLKMMFHIIGLKDLKIKNNKKKTKRKNNKNKTKKKVMNRRIKKFQILKKNFYKIVQLEILNHQKSGETNQMTRLSIHRFVFVQLI